MMQSVQIMRKRQMSEKTNVSYSLFWNYFLPCNTPAPPYKPALATLLIALLKRCPVAQPCS